MMDFRLNRELIYGLLLLFFLSIMSKANAQSVLNVAVASNFAPALELIKNRFTAETGIPVQLTISSSGRFFTQIKQRAPFDLYFSADTKRPEMLYDEGFCSEPVLYATGHAVLWSSNSKLCSITDWQDVVSSSEVKKIGMANPESAPYGTVVRDTCEQLKEWPVIEKKLVYGSNVGQAFQYAATGVADAAFIARSLALTEKGRAGCYWEISESEVVEQKACVTLYGNNIVNADHFIMFATSDSVAENLKKFGYE